MKKQIKLLTFVLLLLVGVFYTNNNIGATHVENNKIVDVEINLSSGGTLVIGEDNELYVTGIQYQGEFGTGVDYSVIEGFTKVDTSLMQGKKINLVSGYGKTYVITDLGYVYTSGGYNAGGEVSNTFKQIDQSLFGDEKVVDAFRSIFYTIFKTESNRYFMASYYAGDESIREVNLPAGVEVKQIQIDYAYNTIYLIDTNGTLWFAPNVDAVFGGVEDAYVWKTVNVPENLKIKQMTQIYQPYFLAEDGRVLYAYWYTGDGQTEYEYFEPGTIGFTDIDQVESFVRFYAPTVYDELPNVKKFDGRVYVGKRLLDMFQVDYNDLPTMIPLSDYLPDADEASLFTVSHRYSVTTAITYVKDNVLYSVNGDDFYSNGYVSTEGALLSPLTINVPFGSSDVVNEPLAAQFAPSSVNPATVTLGPLSQSAIDVQANWQIKDVNGNVVASGIKDLKADGVVDLSGLVFSDGIYTLEYYRETTDAATTWKRSQTTDVQTFTVERAPIDNEDNKPLDPVDPVKPTEILPEANDTSKNDIVKEENIETGDHSNVQLYVVTMLVAAGIFFVVRRKKQEN